MLFIIFKKKKTCIACIEFPIELCDNRTPPPIPTVRLGTWIQIVLS